MQAVRVMLDIRVIRENPEEVKARLKPRSGDAWKLVDDVMPSAKAPAKPKPKNQHFHTDAMATAYILG